MICACVLATALSVRRVNSMHVRTCVPGISQVAFFCFLHKGNQPQFPNTEKALPSKNNSQVRKGICARNRVAWLQGNCHSFERVRMRVCAQYTCTGKTSAPVSLLKQPQFPFHSCTFKKKTDFRIGKKRRVSIEMLAIQGTSHSRARSCTRVRAQVHVYGHLPSPSYPSRSAPVSQICLTSKSL